MADRKAGGPLRAVIYCRISRDAEGDAHGVENQMEDCTKLAHELGYEVVGRYIDNDISASTKSRKPRPDYDEMLAGARAGQFEVIVAYSNSRLTRRPLEVEELIQLHEKHGTIIRTKVSGNDDLSTADGRMVARIKGNVDTAEAERVAERTRRAKEAMAQKGEWLGGKRPYGYEPGGMVIREREAAIVRMATKGIIEGRSLRGLAKELNENGHEAMREVVIKNDAGRPVKDASGKTKKRIEKVAWTSNNLRDMLLRPRNMGHASKGQARAKFFEIGPKATWPEIVDEDTWRACYDVIMDGTRRTNPGGGDVRWLGSGIYRCGVCGGVLRAVRSGRYKKMHYKCIDAAHILIDQAQCDTYVLSEVKIALSKPSIIQAMTPNGPNLAPEREERTRLERRLSNFEKDYSEGLIDGRQLRDATTDVRAKIAALDEKLASSIRRSSASPVMRAGDPAAAFEAAPLDVQRAVITMIATVTVTTAAAAGIGRGQSFNTDRILVDFIDDEPDEGTPPTP